MQRLGVGREVRDHGVPRLVDGDAPLLLGVELRLARIAEHDLVEAPRRSPPRVMLSRPGARRRQRRLVDQVGQIRAGEARRVLGDALQIDVGRERLALDVHAEDGPARRQLGPIDEDAPIEAARPQQRRVEDVGAVGRRDDDHQIGAVEAVHLRQELVQRLLALVVAAAETGAARRAPRRRSRR